MVADKSFFLVIRNLWQKTGKQIKCIVKN